MAYQTITLVAAGTYQAATGGASTTPVAGGAYLAGDALIIHAAQALGADTLATPSGWTLLSADTNAHQCKLFGLIAATSSETMPALNWGPATVSESVVHVFRGVDASFTTTATAADRATNTTANITGNVSARTPSLDGSLVLFGGLRNKTTTTNGVVLSAPTNFTMLAQDAPNGSARISIGTCYWIQTTLAQVPAFTAMTSSLTESVNQSVQGSIIFLQPALIASTTPTRSLLGVGN